MPRLPEPSSPLGELVGEIVGDTPAMRLFSLLEAVASRGRLVTLHGLVEETGLPKPTLHRMLQQLEAAGLLEREGDGRHFGVGVRLRRLAENLIFNDSRHGSRHRILRGLVEELGESCNLTTMANGEIVYLDRVETSAPLRFHLHPGSRVPIHCSASGKMILSQLRPDERRRLLSRAPLDRHTPRTLVDPVRLERELERIRRDGYAIDNQEYLPGLLCVAVPVPAGLRGRPLCVAVQAPVVRLSLEGARRAVPALVRAAARIAHDGSTSSG